jgi:single-strand DNA-binding protein
VTTLTIIGNLTSEPDLEFTPNGIAKLRFTVASTPRVFDKNSGEYRDGDTLFLPCIAWRALAENLAESVAKGTRVIVTGRLSQSSWTTEAGEKRSAISLQVE